MYLDKPLRITICCKRFAHESTTAHDGKLIGVVVDYFGVLTNLERALNFDENIREESLIDWEALKRAVPNEVAQCMQTFEGIAIEDTRECLLAALRRLRDPEAAKIFEQNFKGLERLWEAVAPDPALYPHRREYNWLCSMYIAYRRRKRGARETYGELSAKTRALIEENTTFIRIAETLPVLSIDGNYATRIEDLRSPADKAAALEAALTAELSEDDAGLTYRQLGERLQRLKERTDVSDDAAADRLRGLEAIADEAVRTKGEPERLNLMRPVEYDLFTVLRTYALSSDESYVADCVWKMVSFLRSKQPAPRRVEQFEGVVDARRAVVASRIVESLLCRTRVRARRPKPAVPWTCNRGTRIERRRLRWRRFSHG